MPSFPFVGNNSATLLKSEVIVVWHDSCLDTANLRTMFTEDSIVTDLLAFAILTSGFQKIISVMQILGTKFPVLTHEERSVQSWRWRQA
jgi:uncharacterized protein involved in tellurium resistance